MTTFTLRPVIRRTPGQDSSLPARVRVENQRRGARSAALQCARSLGRHVRRLPQDAEGVPQPIDGWSWSISHTKSFVGGVLFPYAVGFDVERVQNRRDEVVRAACDRAELMMLGGFRWQAFTRLWSAKEAVLKKTLVGLSGLSQCHLTAVPHAHALVIYFAEQHHYVHQRFQHGHYASVCIDDPGEVLVEWDWEDSPAEGAGPAS